MKKILFVVSLIALAGLAWGQELTPETITYTIDGETKTVTAILIGTMQTRMYIEGQNRDTWIVTEKAYRIRNAEGAWLEWGEWELFGDLPYPYATTTTLQNLLLTVVSNKYTEDMINNISALLVIVRNNNNQEYWWENRKYANFMQAIYLIVD